MTTDSEMYGIKFTTTIMNAFHIQNGWGYWFQFSGTMDSPYFSDFEKMLDSVSIQNESVKQDSTTAFPFNNAGVDDKADNSAFGICFLIALAVLIVVVIIVKKSEKNKQVMHDCKSDIIETTDINKEPNGSAAVEGKTVLYCHRCGAKLSIDSVYCDKCGCKQHEQ